MSRGHSEKGPADWSSANMEKAAVRQTAWRAKGRGAARGCGGDAAAGALAMAGAAMPAVSGEVAI